MKNIFFLVAVVIIFYSCKKDKVTAGVSATPSNSKTNEFSATINGVLYSLKEGTNCSFYNNIQGGSSSTTDSVNSCYGIIFTPSDNNLGSIEIYFSYVHHKNLIDPTVLSYGYSLFYDNSHFFNLFSPGAHHYFYDVPSIVGNPSINQPNGVYIRYQESAFSPREWTSFKTLNGYYSVTNTNNHFDVTQNTITNPSYNASASSMEKFPSIFVKATFNCELYSLNSLGQIDSIKIDNASFSGNFIEYMTY